MLKNTSLNSLIANLFLVSAIGMSLPAYPQAIIKGLGAPIPLSNGADLSAWQGSENRSGNASWEIDGKEIKVTQGQGLLVTRLSVSDFIVEFDYWVDKDTQVTAFFRCENPDVINTDTAYEVTLVNQPNGLGAGSIYKLSKVKPSKIAKQWNHIQISAIGRQISVTLNGQTHQINNTQFSAGPIAINYGGGELRVKNVYVTIPGRW